MTRTTALKRDRMHLRLDVRTKRTLERAAAHEMKTITDFVLHAAVRAAERVIESRERFSLTALDWEVFQEALLHPPAPNANLKAAVRRHRAQAR